MVSCNTKGKVRVFSTCLPVAQRCECVNAQFVVDAKTLSTWKATRGWFGKADPTSRFGRCTKGRRHGCFPRCQVATTTQPTHTHNNNLVYINRKTPYANCMKMQQRQMAGNVGVKERRWPKWKGMR